MKRWVRATAQATAAAAKEGSVLGLGGVRVSAKEKTALSELHVALGADPQ